ncbi:MAG: flagellar hook-length control protein FliK [Fimbriimonadaceae bacterium]|nr:flagellar hook-length control protein FliK [Fimbriimonadaceae bacterium]QYK59036.1 MAG: flagellar hook-length control protein FliK [Fimbriimonadaceae bacterium]
MDISSAFWNQTPVATAAQALGPGIKEAATEQAKPVPVQPPPTPTPTGAEADAALMRPVNVLDLFRDWLRPFASDPEANAFLNQIANDPNLTELEMAWPPSPENLEKVMAALGLQPRAGIPVTDSGEFVPAVLPKPAQIVVDRLVQASAPILRPTDLVDLAISPSAPPVTGLPQDFIKAYQSAETSPAVLPRPVAGEQAQPVPQPVPRPTARPIVVEGPIPAQRQADAPTLDPEMVETLRPVSVSVKPVPASIVQPAIVPVPHSGSGPVEKSLLLAAVSDEAVPQPEPGQATAADRPAPTPIAPPTRPVPSAMTVSAPASGVPEATQVPPPTPAVLPKPTSVPNDADQPDAEAQRPVPVATKEGGVNPAVLPRASATQTVPKPRPVGFVADSSLTVKKDNAKPEPVLGKPVPAAQVASNPEVLPSPEAPRQQENPAVLPKAVAQSVQRQILDRIDQALAMRAPNRVVIQLDPGDLGTIVLDVKSFGGKNEATVTASDDAVRLALAANRAELVQSIESRGLNLSQFNVAQDGTGQGQQRFDQAAMQDAVRTAQLAATHIGREPAAPVPTVRPRTTAVDYMA